MPTERPLYEIISRLWRVGQVVTRRQINEEAHKIQETLNRDLAQVNIVLGIKDETINQALANSGNKCLTIACRNPPGNVKQFRGLCMKCYASAKKLVEAGSATWESLESMGMVLPREEDLFTSEFERRNKSHD